MTNELTTTQLDPATLEKLVTSGDLSGLTPTQRVLYYRARCEAAGLDYRTQPFRYIVTDGKLSLYADKGATEQLGKNNGVSYTIVSKGVDGDCYIVEMQATDKGGRTASDLGAVSIKSLGGTNLANAMMKAVTKARRRATLALVGLGLPDESEIDAIPGARVVDIDPTTGEADLPDFGARIYAATTKGQLDKIGMDISNAVGMGEEERAGLRAAWTRRANELLAPRAEVGQ
jgi:hypothetical protein